MSSTSLSFAASANAATLAYDAAATGDFGLVDIATGVFTLRGNTGFQLAGLAVGPDGAIYSGRYHGSQFYRINPADGSASLIGSSSNISYLDIGSTLSGIYGLGDDQYLYSIDVYTGAAFQIGYAGFTPTIIGMSAGSADLYISWRNRYGLDNLYRVNTTNAFTALVGHPGAAFGALVAIGGTLYGGSDPGNAVYALDTATGNSTFRSDISGTSHAFFGLAPVSAGAVPESSTWAMMIVGFGLVGGALRIRALSTPDTRTNRRRAGHPVSG